MYNPQEDQKKKAEMATRLAQLRPLITGEQRMMAALRFGISIETVNRYFRGKVCKLTTAQSLYDYLTTLNQL